MASKFIVRVRHSEGTTRIELPQAASTTVQELKQILRNQLSSHPNVSGQQLTANGKLTDIPFTNNVKLSSLNIKHGDMIYLKVIKTKNNKKKRKLNEVESNTSSPSNKRIRLNSNDTNNDNQNDNASNRNSKNLKSKQSVKKKGIKKKKAKKSKDQFLVIRWEGNCADEIADNYLSETNALERALDLLPLDVQKNYDANARIEAILEGKVKITEYLERSRFSSNGKSRGQRHLIVEYSFKRKRRKETVCFYEDEEIGQIIKSILLKSMNEDKRKSVFEKVKTSKKDILQLMETKNLTPLEIAQRSPPILWSLFHSFPDQKIQDVVEEFVQNALTEL